MESLFQFVPPDEREHFVTPPGVCPVCTKDLDANGWCFECREERIEPAYEHMALPKLARRIHGLEARND